MGIKPYIDQGVLFDKIIFKLQPEGYSWMVPQKKFCSRVEKAFSTKIE